MSLTSNNTNEMSSGQIKDAADKIQGTINDAAKSISAGKTPDFTGGADNGFSAADVAASKFTAGAGVGMQIAMSTHEHLGGGQSQSSFFQPTHKSKGGRPRDALGHDMGYKQLQQAARQEARIMWHIKKTGRMPHHLLKNDVFRSNAGSVFGESMKQTAMSIGPGGYVPKFMRLTPQMMINLGLVPSQVKLALDQLRDVEMKPGDAQIVNGFKNNEASGEDLYKKANDSTQDRVLQNLSQDVQKEKSKFRMPKPGTQASTLAIATAQMQAPKPAASAPRPGM